MSTQLAGDERRVVLELDGLQWASETHAVEAVLGRQPGVLGVQANPVAQTATVTYDPARTTVRTLAGWVRDCGYHCRGESVPDHLCLSPEAPDVAQVSHRGHDMPMDMPMDMDMGGGAAPDRLGSPAQVGRYAAEARAGHLFGVWNTEDPAEGVHLEALPNGRYRDRKSVV